MIDHAADLLSDFAGIVHDNERRWRVFRSRVEHIVAALPATETGPSEQEAAASRARGARD